LGTVAGFIQFGLCIYRDKRLSVMFCCVFVSAASALSGLLLAV
jgi:hypothetical protein